MESMLSILQREVEKKPKEHIRAVSFAKAENQRNRRIQMQKMEKQEKQMASHTGEAEEKEKGGGLRRRRRTGPPHMQKEIQNMSHTCLRKRIKNRSLK